MFKWTRSRRAVTSGEVEGCAVEERPPLDRRGVLRYGGLAAAGAAGAALTNVAGASPASAANGDNLVLGVNTNNASAPTQLNYSSGPGFKTDDLGFGVADQGAPPSGWGPFNPAIGGYAQETNFATGVLGAATGTATGVLGTCDGGGTGVIARGSAMALIANGGLDGESTFPAVQVASNARGPALLAIGSATATSPTLRATSGRSGQPAVKAAGTIAPAGGSVTLAGNNAALAVAGVATFTRSGIATVTSAATSLVVPVPGQITTGSFILATLQGTASGTLAVQSAASNPSNGTITIYFTGTAPTGTKVAWLVLA